MSEMKVLYTCDPDKNVECSKLNCHKTGGICTRTTRMEYMKAFTNVNLIMPMSDEDFKSLEKGGKHAQKKGNFKAK